MRIDNPMILSNEDLHNWRSNINDRLKSEEPDQYKILDTLADEIYGVDEEIAKIALVSVAIDKAREHLQEAINLIDDYLTKK